MVLKFCTERSSDLAVPCSAQFQNDYIHEIYDMLLNGEVVYFTLKYDEFWRSGLTHWGRVTHICVGELTIIASDNGLSPERRQAIIWTNAGILLIGPLGTNFSETFSESQAFSLKKIRLKMSSAKYSSFRLGLNVLLTTNEPDLRW